jgi:cytochrome c553
MKMAICTLVAVVWATALAPGAARAQDANLARNLAATCANCHGTNGQARGLMKVLAGQPADRTISAMADYKSGAQPATVMHQIAKGYTDEQIRLVAGYFAAQPVKQGGRP